MHLNNEIKIIGSIILVSVFILGGAIFLLPKTEGRSEDKKVAEDQVISKSGLHWHPKLSIFIKGQKQELEEDIGLEAIHEPIHTHKEDYKNGVVHMEMNGVVTKDETKLGNFFKIWGREFNSTQIFDEKNSEEGKVKMTVNGKENKSFENYLMKDGDLIEIRYE